MSFVHTDKRELEVEPVCTILSGLRWHIQLRCRYVPAMSAQRVTNQRLKKLIQEVREENYEVYGVVDVWHELRRASHDVRRDRVVRLMGGGELTDEDLGNLIALLLFAHKTTESALAVGVFSLLHHPDQLAALCADLTKVSDPVEAILRYLTVNQYKFFRTALEGIELGSELVARGDTVTMSLPAASRDPERTK